MIYVNKSIPVPPILNADRKIRIFLSTGEVSGDLIGANLARALRAAHSDVVLSGVGGTRMEEAGVDVFFKSNHLGTVGIGEAFAAIPDVLKSFKRIRSHMLEYKPDLAILIGHDAFHLVLSHWLMAKKILTVSYFPPQVWLWRGIVKMIARSYDWILTSFVEEELVYRQAGARTSFVGHYLRDQIEEISLERKAEARQSQGIRFGGSVIGLFPGSRFHELDRLTPLFLDTARRMIGADPSIRFILPVADDVFLTQIKGMIDRAALKDRVYLTTDSREAMAACDLVILCSGTVTLEAALMGLPMIIIYQAAWSTWVTVRVLDATGFIESKTAGLPNLLVGKKIVPEMIQSEALASRVADEAFNIIHDPAGQARMRRNLRSVKTQLGEKGVGERAARLIIDRAVGVAGRKDY